MQLFNRFAPIIGLTVLLLGCGADSTGYRPTAAKESSARGFEAEGASVDFEGAMAGMQSAQASPQTTEVRTAGGNTGDADEAVGKTAPPRKIIYNADVRLVVQDFDVADAELRKMVAERGGFLSSAAVDRTSGRYRTGRWIVRLPVEQYVTFLADIGSLGIPESLSEDAQDVTEEFVDVQARIANKQKLEQRIVDLLKETKDGVKDVIEVERELGRVREEIERMQGRLRYLQDQTSLCTITISVTERRDYQPPQALTFGGRVSETWSSSWSGLLTFGKNLFVFLVAAIPWFLAVGLFVVLPMYLLLRAVIRRLGRVIQAAPVDGER